MGYIPHGVVLHLKGLAPHIVLLKLVNESAETTAAGYQLFAPEMAERVKRVRILQSERRTLAEIRQELVVK